MKIKEFWDNAVSYDEYMKEAKEAVAHPKPGIDTEYHEYFELGVHRMERTMKIFNPSEEQLKLLADKDFKGKILIISEPWCGDASNAVPIVVKLFNDNEVRITYRDQEPSLIDDFLTNGSKSIPVVIFLDNDFNVIAHWGPRPAYGRELFEKHKKDPVAYDKEEFHNDVQKYYALNKGHDTAQELLELL
ncbi:MAG: thioredoxin family protein [Chitinophagaceae bacterium]|nr:thioredoxin family protein [Chitinophagaceae bacterium]